MPGPERRLIGEHLQRRLTSCFEQPTETVLPRPLESTLSLAAQQQPQDDRQGRELERRLAELDLPARTEQPRPAPARGDTGEFGLDPVEDDAGRVLDEGGREAEGEDQEQDRADEERA